ncbi:MAG: hypothetical protein ACK2UB_00860 [Anaerolineales bacterium]
MKKHPTVFLLALCSLLLIAVSAAPPSVAEKEPAINVRITTTVESDGSGTFKLEIVLGKEFLGMVKSFSEFTDASVCDSFSEGVEDFPQMTESEGDGSITCSAFKPFDDLEGLQAITEHTFDAGTFQRLEIDGGHFYYDLAANVDSALTWEADMPFDMEAWWIVRVPGEVVDTNADSVSGRTLSWDLMTMNSASHMRVESKIGGSGGLDPALLAVGGVLSLGCCCIVVLIAAAAVFILVRKK